jgi:H+-translocating NAD(P) transhydrogenase subunit alpha
MTLITEITIFVLAAFVGFEVISKVPTTLHTPLMSQTNAIHGIVLLGGLIVVGLSDNVLDNVIATIAIAFGTINIVGGFMVTDRMLGMFIRRPKPSDEHQEQPAASSQRAQASGDSGEAGIRPGAAGSDQERAEPDSK